MDPPSRGVAVGAVNETQNAKATKVVTSAVEGKSDA